MSSNLKTFSHIYIEEEAMAFPKAQEILNRFPNTERITIKDYQSIFGRHRQNFREQKKSPKLILAVKKDNFLYRGNKYIQEKTGFEFYYNALVLNCLYDCQYCYLQGMYPGANCVVFVNTEPYFAAIESILNQNKSTQQMIALAISYDTDLLALENRLGLVDLWIEWARQKQNFLLEIRTKSAHEALMKQKSPNDSVLFAWTVSPDWIIDRYEWGTPKLNQRLKAISNALDHGWQVRLCIDPILYCPDWETKYAQLIKIIEEKIGFSRFYDIHLGVFRTSLDYFKNMKSNTQTDLLHYPFSIENRSVTYDATLRNKLINYLSGHLQSYNLLEKLVLWT